MSPPLNLVTRTEDGAKKQDEASCWCGHSGKIMFRKGNSLIVHCGSTLNWGFLQNCIFRLLMTNRVGDGKQTVKLLTLVESHDDEMKMHENPSAQIIHRVVCS